MLVSKFFPCNKNFPGLNSDLNLQFGRDVEILCGKANIWSASHGTNSESVPDPENGEQHFAFTLR